MVSTSMFPAAKPRRFEVASRRSKDPTGNSGAQQGKIHGLGPLTRVTTAFGQVHAHTLRERDRVRSKNGEFVAITKIDRLTLDEGYLQYHPGAQPILVRAGAFARGIPAADIMLAPHQQLDSQQIFITPGADEAMDALHKPHVCRKSESVITYTTFQCEKPVAVCCEGLWVTTGL